MLQKIAPVDDDSMVQSIFRIKQANIPFIDKTPFTNGHFL